MAAHFPSTSSGSRLIPSPALIPLAPAKKVTIPDKKSYIDLIFSQLTTEETIAFSKKNQFNKLNPTSFKFSDSLPKKILAISPLAIVVTSAVEKMSTEDMIKYIHSSLSQQAVNLDKLRILNLVQLSLEIIILHFEEFIYNIEKINDIGTKNLHLAYLGLSLFCFEYLSINQHTNLDALFESANKLVSLFIPDQTKNAKLIELHKQFILTLGHIKPSLYNRSLIHTPMFELTHDKISNFSICKLFCQFIVERASIVNVNYIITNLKSSDVNPIIKNSVRLFYTAFNNQLQIVFGLCRRVLDAKNEDPTFLFLLRPQLMILCDKFNALMSKHNPGFEMSPVFIQQRIYIPELLKYIDRIASIRQDRIYSDYYNSLISDESETEQKEKESKLEAAKVETSGAKKPTQYEEPIKPETVRIRTSTTALVPLSAPAVEVLISKSTDPTTFPALISSFRQKIAEAYGINPFPDSFDLSKEALTKENVAKHSQSHQNLCLELLMVMWQESPSVELQDFIKYVSYGSIENSFNVPFLKEHPETEVLPHRFTFFTEYFGMKLKGMSWMRSDFNIYSIFYRYKHHLKQNIAEPAPSSATSHSFASIMAPATSPAPPPVVPAQPLVVTSTSTEESAKKTNESEEKEMSEFSKLMKDGLKMQSSILKMKTRLTKTQMIEIAKLDSKIDVMPIESGPYKATPIADLKATEFENSFVYSSKKLGNELAKIALNLDEHFEKIIVIEPRGSFSSFQRMARLNLLEHLRSFSKLFMTISRYPGQKFHMLHMQFLLVGGQQIMESFCRALEMNPEEFEELGIKKHDLSYLMARSGLSKNIEAGVLNEIYLHHNFFNKANTPHKYYAIVPEARRSKFMKRWESIRQLSIPALKDGDGFETNKRIRGNSLKMLTTTCQEMLHTIQLFSREYSSKLTPVPTAPPVVSK